MHILAHVNGSEVYETWCKAPITEPNTLNWLEATCSDCLQIIVRFLVGSYGKCRHLGVSYWGNTARP